MKVFVDTNILIDVLGNRVPFVHESISIWTLAEHRKIEAVISAVTVTNIFYILRKLTSQPVAYNAIRQLSDVFTIAPCDEMTIRQAIALNLKDFEDAVQLTTAAETKSECIITRNAHHFPADRLPILTPSEFLVRDDVAALRD